MTEYIGNVAVPEIVASGVFPIVPDFPYGRSHKPEVAIHRFGSGNSKIEQRFLLGDGAKRFTVRKAALSEADREALVDFWELKYGPFGVFTYNAPNDDANGTTAYTVRFANEPLSWEMISNAAATIGVTLVEIPTSSPTYAISQTVTRFPTAGLQAALLSQVQEIVPLVKIQPRTAGYPAIYVSDRKCTVGGQLHQPRLLEWDGISQSTGNEADQAQFTFGNADRVMRDLANDCDLFRAIIEFSLYHVGTGIKLDLWKGEIIDWRLDSGPEFPVVAADGIYELTLPYPTRRISRSCWKIYDDGNGCPYAGNGSLDLVHFPNASGASCDKGYDTDNGCLAHGMKTYFGGILAEPQAVKTKDNSQGTWGFGRPTITSVSLVQDSIYDQVVPEIYTDNESWKDTNGDIKYGRIVNAKIAAGREEGDFYEAMGVVCEGPVTFGTGHKLDNQYNHNWPGAPRTIPGTDPAGDLDFFSLDQVGTSTGGDFRKVVSGNSIYLDNFAAGTAAVVIRRTDEKGIQLSYPGGHEMQAVVLNGQQGWVWSGAGSRSFVTLTNPIWVAVNMLLKARGLRYASAAVCEEYFDVDAAVAAAAICDLQVPPLVSRSYRYWSEEGGGHWEGGELQDETQFLFQGVVQEEKPLRDWIQEVLINCVGYYTFAFGKLKLGIRCNSSAVEAFTAGNIIWQSLKLSPHKPTFNHLTANFGDTEFAFAANSVTAYDIDHAKLIGGATAPLFLKSQLNLAGSNYKSQAARIATVRLREELGGISPAQWKAAREISFSTTVLALNAEPGMVCSMTHEDMPDGWLNGVPTANYGEFRVIGWKLNKDYSIDIEGRTTYDQMYDLVEGPKPADVAASAVPGETSVIIRGVPDDLTAVGYASGTRVCTGAVAWKWNDGIYQGDFRARLRTATTIARSATWSGSYLMGQIRTEDNYSIPATGSLSFWVFPLAPFEHVTDWPNPIPSNTSGWVLATAVGEVPDSPDTPPTIFGIQGGGDCVNPGTILAGWRVPGSDKRVSASSALMPLGIWSNVILTWQNGGYTRLYLNNQLAGETDNLDATFDTSPYKLSFLTGVQPEWRSISGVWANGSRLAFWSDYILSAQDRADLQHLPPELVAVADLLDAWRLTKRVAMIPGGWDWETSQVSSRRLGSNNYIGMSEGKTLDNTEATTEQDYADLRTPEEGGDLVDDGITGIIRNGLPASQWGCNYSFDPGFPGDWFFAYRLRNKKGWSVWSDGNDLPLWVKDHINTKNANDTGPPADWTIKVEEGPRPNTVIVRCSRPKINGNMILFTIWQIRDGRVTSPGWLDLDANIPPALVFYDGSDETHALDPTSLRRYTKASAGYGSVDPIGGSGCILIDVRNSGNWDLAYTLWTGGPGGAQFEGGDPATARWFELTNPISQLTPGNDFRLKFVVPPWCYDTGGYFGLRGYTGKEYWQIKNADGSCGDQSSDEFVSLPMELPAGVSVRDVVARCWFFNAYSCSDGGIYSQMGSMGGVVELPIVGGHVATDTRLGNRFVVYVTEDFILDKPTGLTAWGDPIAWIFVQKDAGGRMTLADGFRSTDSTPLIELSTTPEGVRDYMAIMYAADEDLCDIVAFVPNLQPGA